MEWISIKWIKFRILSISLLFVLFLGAILFRSYQLHISENSRVHHLAEKQYKAALALHPKRGTIYDRNGKILAGDVQVDSVAIHPPQVEDPEAVVRQLSSVLHLSAEKIRPKLQSDKKFEWVARRVSPSESDALAKLKIKGVSLIPEYRRFYPNRDLAGNFLGAVGYDAKALGGIELAFDSFLRTGSGVVFADRDAKGRLYGAPSSEEINHDIYLTIDTNLQFVAEKYLAENARKYNVESGFALVMDPKTGEIAALANYPSLNPNTYWEYEQEYWKNHAIIDTFEPGSTFKTVLAAAAIDAGGIKPTDQFYCEHGSYRIGKKTIHDHGAYDHLTLAEIVKVSSNIGITKVAQKLGKDAFHDAMVRIGVGQSTGLDFPGEARGVLPPLKRWSALEQSNMAFGQGLTVTGVQMTQIYSIFANNGVRMKPYLISKIVNSKGGVVFENHPTPLGQVIAPETAQSITSMLTQVVESGGTGGMAKVKGYAAAGKTGTAQKVDPRTRSYAEDKYVSSFIGYVPADDPAYVIYVVYDTPKSQYYGGVVAAPVFSNIAGEAMALAGIPPRQEMKLAKAPPSQAGQGTAGAD